MSEFRVGQGIPKISEFNPGLTQPETPPIPVSYVETMPVADGVECDTYTFDSDPTKDLAIVRVLWAHRTPLQRVLSGVRTTEGYVAGEGTLSVTSADGETRTYEFGPTSENQPVDVQVGETMQWAAYGETDLTFYEICEPPYEDGRFDNLSE